MSGYAAPEWSGSTGSTPGCCCQPPGITSIPTTQPIAKRPLSTQDTIGAGTDILVSIANLVGGTGNDTLTGNGSDNSLDGGLGADSIGGGGGLDVILGGLGADTIDGGAGADLVVGGTGADSLTGGANADVFRYLAQSDGLAAATDTATNAAADVIVDFAQGVDSLAFLSAEFGGLAAGALQAANFASIAAAYDGTNSGVAGGTPVFVFSTDEDRLYFDADTATAGYTVIAEIGTGNLVVDDIDITAG
ncbi:MAG: M10 family metallopeptidase C-terminal domain-containing protein [Alphaproteobacteria bacterium]